MPKGSFSSAPDVAENRNERAADAVGQFARQRNAAHRQLAVEHFEEHDAARCREELEASIEFDPNDLDSRLALAELCLFEGDGDSARFQLETALQQNANDSRANYLLGLVFEESGQDAMALVCYETAEASAAAATAGSFEPAGAGIVVTDRVDAESAMAAPAAGNATTVDVAVSGHSRDVQAGLASRQRRAEMLLQRGRTELVQGRTPAARDILLNAVSSIPTDSRLAGTAALVALQYNQPALAIELLETALPAHPDAAPLYRILGTARYRQGDFSGAQSAFARAVSLDNASALSYVLWGCSQVRLGQPEAARSSFEQAGRLDPRFARLP